MGSYVRHLAIAQFLAALFLTVTAALAIVAAAADGRPGGCQRYPGYAAAQAALDRAAATSDTKKANEALEMGLKALRYEYLGRSSSIQDDTGLHLSLAHYYELHGDLAWAVRIRKTILDDRLELFRDTHSCKD